MSVLVSLNANVPLGWKTWMRWLAVSATAILPSGPMATPRGLLKSSSLLDGKRSAPILNANVPLGWKTWTW